MTIHALGSRQADSRSTGKMPLQCETGRWAGRTNEAYRVGEEDCDAGVTQTLPSLTTLTSLTVLAVSDSITYAAAMRPGEFGLQVRLPHRYKNKVVVDLIFP
jgi:hypothetical protein